MRLLKSLTLAAMFLALFGCNNSSDGNTAVPASESTTSATYTISGDVYGDTTDRIYITSEMVNDLGGSLNIYLKKGSDTIATTSVDENGHYSFPDIPNGTYNIRAESWVPLFDGSEISLHDDFTVTINDADITQDITIQMHHEED